MPKSGDVIKSGHWIYGGTTRCRVEIQFSNTRSGSGDYEDPPEWQEDRPGDWFVVSYSCPTDPDRCAPGWKDGQGCATLAEAVAQAENILRACNLEWET